MSTENPDLDPIMEAMRPFDHHEDGEDLWLWVDDAALVARDLVAVERERRNERALSAFRYGSDAIAEQFHDTYERLAPTFGYTTRSESAVPWSEVPSENRMLMRSVVAQVVGPLITAETERCIAIVRELATRLEDAATTEDDIEQIVGVRMAQATLHSGARRSELSPPTTPESELDRIHELRMADAREARRKFEAASSPSPQPEEKP